MIIAKTILEQIGHQSLFMIGATNFLSEKNSVSFRMKGSKVANYLKVTLEGDDTYTMEFGKIWGKKYNIVENITNVYFDELNKNIEEITGLYTRI